MTVNSSYIVKICVLGEANVGKTSLVYRFIEKNFRGNYKSTLGVNLLKKDLNIKEFGDVSAQIWDLGGQESFKALRKLYLEGANGALIIYDCTKRSSYDKLEDWILDFKDARGDQPLLLLGNKTDLKNAIKVQESEGVKLAKRYNMEFMPTSAKTGSNVESAFMEIINKILAKNLDS
ncbi:MAG: GTP-binding protein [Candidatus Lokiarchaeota archaeon]|nr:GTP-binding protein [Candidatus Lokiarchaeota archaeon]